MLSYLAFLLISSYPFNCVLFDADLFDSFII
jgi:hypothetical protein